MKRQTELKNPAKERQLIKIMRRLAPERASQVIDFAQFLDFQQTKNHSERRGDSLAVNEEHTEAESIGWDALLATDEAQTLLESMADEAFREIQAGQAKPMAFTPDGQMIPG